VSTTTGDVARAAAPVDDREAQGRTAVPPREAVSDGATRSAHLALPRGDQPPTAGPDATTGPNATTGQDASAGPDATAGPAATARARESATGRARRWARRVTAGAVALAVGASPFLLTDPRSPWSHAGDPAVIRLYSDGLAVTADGSGPVAVPAGTTARYLPGSRVLDPGPGADAATSARALGAAAASRAWLAEGSIPGAGGPYEDMARGALLDLRALLLDDGAAVAAWSPRWRYVWPRDSSFVAVALARTGHVDDAVEILEFLQRVQHRDGSFEARYLPDGSGPPDARGVQTDGTGWVLWAAQSVLAELPDDAARTRTARRLRPLLDRSTDHVLALTGGRSALPPPSSDYWELRERKLTLGTAAPLLAGLTAAGSVYATLGEPVRSRAADERADALRDAVVAGFGPDFARYAGGRHADAATAFLLPPFQPRPLPGALEAWQRSAPAMSRPAGGLAPGAGWKDDGVSWTPQTSLYALTAATTGDAPQADVWLTWIDAHRTSSGAIPEKVLADGSPAAVAPLAWSAACVLLALDALDAREPGDA
jgi:glucoamylase